MALTDNLVSYWKFDESSGDASDAVGSNLLTNNATATYEPGKINNAAKLVKTSSQFFKNASPVGLPTGDMTIQIWVNLSIAPAANNEFDLMSWFSGPGNQRSWLFDYVDAAGTKLLDFETCADGVNNHSYQVHTTLTTGTWYHLVVVYTAATHTAQLYINGAAQTAGDVTDTALFNSSAPLQIGARNTTPDGFCDSDVDEAAIWSRTLTGDEVTSLYNGGDGLQYPFSTPLGFNVALI